MGSPNTDRAEELRVLSDFDLGYRLGELSQQKRQDADGSDLVEIEAERVPLACEWYRRCDEREAQDDYKRRFRRLGEELAEYLWSHNALHDCGMEASDFLESHGIIRAAVYDPEKHADLDVDDRVDPGDRFYTLVWEREAFGLDAEPEREAQEGGEVVGVDLARPGSTDMNARAIRQPDGTVHVEFEGASEGQEDDQ